MLATAFHWFWDLSGKWYIFWSGVGANLTLLTGLGIVWRKIGCHTRHCWRLGHHPIAGTPYKVCRRHHPDVPNRGPTVEELTGNGPAV